MRILILLVLLYTLITGTAMAGGSMTVNGSATVSEDLTAGQSTLKVDSTNQKVGVGTTTPQEKLDVNGTIKAHFINATNGISCTGGTIGAPLIIGTGGLVSNNALEVAGNLIWANLTQNKVGIGTYAPEQKLDVNGFMRAARIGIGPGGVYSLFDAHGNNGDMRLGFGGDVLEFTSPNGASIRALDEYGGDISFRTGGSYETRMILKNDGNVGIGTYWPEGTLDVNGVLYADGILNHGPIVLENVQAYEDTYDPPMIWAHGGIIWVADWDDDATAISPHLDPRQLNPAATTSFSDPKVEYPFSFYHRNGLLGKEQAIDMAKLVAWAEKKMQSEIGEEAGRLVFTRDLPTSQCTTIEQHNTVQSEQQARQVLAKLNKMPWIKVPWGPTAPCRPWRSRRCRRLTRSRRQS